MGEEDEAPVHHPSLSKKTTHPSAPLPLPSSAAAVPLLAQVWIWSLADYLVRCRKKCLYSVVHGIAGSPSSGLVWDSADPVELVR